MKQMHAPQPLPQTEEEIELRIPHTSRYLISMPAGYADDERQWPLLVFLHGAGERGDDLTLVRRHGPPRLIDEGRKFPAIVVSPQCPSNNWWNLAALEMLIDNLMVRHRVDPNRVYVTGISMGGFGTWGLAQRRPERFAAIVPICGGGDPNQASRLRNLPTWVFHGALDDIVVADESQRMVDAMRAAGGSPRFTLYPEAMHDSWTEAYATEELWTWLFAQRQDASDRV